MRWSIIYIYTRLTTITTTKWTIIACATSAKCSCRLCHFRRFRGRGLFFPIRSLSPLTVVLSNFLSSCMVASPHQILSSNWTAVEFYGMSSFEKERNDVASWSRWLQWSHKREILMKQFQLEIHNFNFKILLSEMANTRTPSSPRHHPIRIKQTTFFTMGDGSMRAIIPPRPRYTWSERLYCMRHISCVDSL